MLSSPLRRAVGSPPVKRLLQRVYDSYFAGVSGDVRLFSGLYPDFAAAHYNLGVVLAAQGKGEEAAGHYREALRIDPRLSAPGTHTRKK